jgi:undecaprenyl diphosphate synthase
MNQRSAESEAALNPMPRHVAIIMDGNGRWASKRHLPRVAGHQKGISAVRLAVEYALENQIAYLTLFAFSSENWQRPISEVNALINLFETVLTQELSEICKQHVKLNIIGDISRFPDNLQQAILDAMTKTADHNLLTLNVAVNYGGRWDIVQAISRLIEDRVLATDITEETFRSYLSLGDVPDPDLFIRTGGEKRISNFLLWHLAYTELYFTDILWPDFSKDAFQDAVIFYRQRERRFGKISNQVPPSC